MRRRNQCGASGLHVPLDLRPGRFYGLPQGNAGGGPFTIHSLAATGCEEDIETHTHHDAHFVFVLSGTYVTSAYGASEAARPPRLDLQSAWDYTSRSLHEGHRHLHDRLAQLSHVPRGR